MNLHCPVIREWERRFRENTALLEHLLTDVGQEEAVLRPAPESWSVSECVAHLNRAAAAYLEQMEPAAEEARRRERAGRAPYGRGPWAGRLLSLIHISEPTRPY